MRTRAWRTRELEMASARRGAAERERAERGATTREAIDDDRRAIARQPTKRHAVGTSVIALYLIVDPGAVGRSAH